jgi:uncharacterized coiled-coil protein SlyX
VHQAVAHAKEEIAQLRATVAALRDELERARIAHEEAVAAAQAQHRAEIAQLQSTVRELRARLQASAAESRGAE